jgi:hypothetical protein
VIQIKQRGNLVGPVGVCDHCGEEIADAADASCVWQETLNTKGKTLGTFYFVHYDCDDEFMRSRGEKGKTWSSVELDVWLAYLTNNVKWNGNEARRKAALLAAYLP